MGECAVGEGVARWGNEIAAGAPPDGMPRTSAAIWGTLPGIGRKGPLKVRRQRVAMKLPMTRLVALRAASTAPRTGSFSAR